jgi:glucan phosphoethanolaminetransferase (alkaline phosphatase superfamily)
MFLLLLCHIGSIASYFVIFTNGITDAIWEIAAMYLCYYGLMSLQTVIIFAYCAFLEALFVFRCLKILSVLGEEHFTAPVVFFLQLLVYGYGGYILFGKLRKYRNRDPKTDSMTPEEIAEDDGGKVKEKKRKSKSKKGDEESTPAPRASMTTDQVQ